MTQLWLIRHGESEWNLRELVQGQSPTAGSLTPRGIEQAQAVGRRLASIGVTATVVVTSDLPRAQATATIVAATLDLPVRVDAGLREQHLGVLEGLPLAGSLGETSVAERIARLWRLPGEAPDGGESIVTLQARVVATLRRLAADAPAGELVVVTHGGPIRVLRCLEHPELLALGRGLIVGNGSLTRVHVDTEGNVEVIADPADEVPPPAC